MEGYVDYLIAEATIKRIFEFYKVSHAFGKDVKKYFETQLNENLGYLASNHNLPTPSSFEELVDDYIESFLRFSVINNFLIITRDQRLPYSLERTIELLLERRRRHLSQPRQIRSS